MKEKVALVTDIMTFPGGAERLMMSMLKLYPDADIYTSVFIKKNYWEIKNKVFTAFKLNFITTWLYRFSFTAKILSSYYSVLSPIGFEKFNLQNYDLVITLSARSAKGVITAPYATHINYILTPPRYEWDNDSTERVFRKRGLNKIISPLLSTFFRSWDYYAVRRADYNIALSEFIAKKVKKIYGMKAKVIYPGIASIFEKEITEEEIYKAQTELQAYQLDTDYYLVVSRLYDYKKVDLAIKACIENKKNLIIVGDGPDRKFLQKLIRKAKAEKRILMLGRKSDLCIKYLYSKAQALLFCGIEDFGLVPVEAMAQGCPVISYGVGGGAETIVAGKTGELFKTYEELVDIVAHFAKTRYNKQTIIDRAKEFSEERFLENLKFTIAEMMNTKL